MLPKLVYLISHPVPIPYLNQKRKYTLLHFKNGCKRLIHINRTGQHGVAKMQNVGQILFIIVLQ